MTVPTCRYDTRIGGYIIIIYRCQNARLSSGGGREKGIILLMALREIRQTCFPTDLHSLRLPLIPPHHTHNTEQGLTMYYVYSRNIVISYKYYIHNIHILQYIHILYIG